MAGPIQAGARPVRPGRAWRTSFLMGFSSGLPFLLVGTLVQGWMTDLRVSVGLIGLVMSARLPYSLKFLWAPWLDYFSWPFLGRRRGWLLVSQAALQGGLWALSAIDPRQTMTLFAACLFVCAASATQDVTVDAYRREDLTDDQLPAGIACYMWGYRLGMVAVSFGGLMAAERIGWPWVFRGLSLILLIGPLTTFLSPEPAVEKPKIKVSLAEVVVAPLAEFLKRPHPWLLLLFIFFYKFGDQLGASLNTAFLMGLGYAKAEIAAIAKVAGLAASLAGVALGGLCVARLGLKAALWMLGFGQMVSTFGFTALCYLPHSLWSLGAVVCFENITAGAGSSAFATFMTKLTNRQFSATQYALLSSLMSLPTTLLSSPAGFLSLALGWPGFYVFSGLLALPGFWLLYRLGRAGMADFPLPFSK